MAELLKKYFYLCLKEYRLKLINRECDKYFNIQKKLREQGCFINILIDRYEKTYGESLRAPKKEGVNK